MNELITIALLSTWMIYNIITKLTKKSKQDYNYVVSFAFIVGYLYFLLLDDINSELFPYYQYAVLIVFIIQLLVTNLLSSSLKNNGKYDLADLENELSNKINYIFKQENNQFSYTDFESKI